MPETVVVMAAHNAQATIAAAVQSVLRQLGRDGEIHVWNDGSTDDTASVLARLRDSRLRVHHSEVSVGSGAGRARLVEMTDSRYVANLDADDIWFPWHLSAARTSLGYYDIVFASALRFGLGYTRVRPTRLSKLDDRDARLALLVHNPFFHSSMVAKRSAIVDSGSYRSLRRGQDYDLWLRAALESKLLRMPKYSVAYRQSSTQISNSDGYLKNLAAGTLLGDQYLNLFQSVMRSNGGVTDMRDFYKSIPELMARPNRRYYQRLIMELSSPVFVEENGEYRWRGR